MAAFGGGQIGETMGETIAGEYWRVFVTAIQSDMYPEEFVECVFGVQMSGMHQRVGNAVFNAWITLIRLGVATKPVVVATLCQGAH